jgi:hypothetical protein
MRTVRGPTWMALKSAGKRPRNASGWAVSPARSQPGSLWRWLHSNGASWPKKPRNVTPQVPSYGRDAGRPELLGRHGAFSDATDTNCFGIKCPRFLRFNWPSRRQVDIRRHSR